MDEFNFVSVNKASFGGVKPVENRVRISPSSVSVAGNIAAQFQPRENANGNFVAKVSFQYDAQRKAIRLVADENGFSLSSTVRDGSYSTNTPRNLVKLGAPVGDYVLVEGRVNIFKLAQ